MFAPANPFNWSCVTYRKAPSRFPSLPELTLWTRIPTVWFRFAEPAPEAEGERTMIWLYVTEIGGGASTVPKKTCIGGMKPEPTIVTRVPPSFEPVEGSTDVIE